MSESRREAFKTVLLIGLLALSFALSSRIWFPPVPEQTMVAYRPAYVAPDARSDLDWQELVHPESLLVAKGRGAWGTVVPDHDLAELLWHSLVQVLARIDVDRLDRADGGLLQQWYSGSGAVGGAEATLPGPFRLRLWQQLWAAQAGLNQPPASGSPPLDPLVERVAVLMDGSDRTWGVIWTTDGPLATLIDDGDSAGATATGLQRLLEIIVATDGALTDAVPLPGSDVLTVPAGMFTTDWSPDASPPLLQLAPPQLDWDAVARAFFAEPNLTRRLLIDDVYLYTDGLSSLSIRAAEGVLEYQAGVAAAGASDAPAPTLPQALAAAVAFGNEHGGWPEGAFLVDVSAIRQRGVLQELGSEPPVSGYRLEFAVRHFTVPLRRPALVTAEVTATGVRFWQRRFLANRLHDPLGNIPFTLQPAVDALAVAGAALSESGAAGPDGEVHRHVLRNVRLVYTPQGDDYYVPTWLFTLEDGSAVTVGAWAGSPARIIPPES